MDDGGVPYKKIRPIGVVVIVILYWTAQAPGAHAWHEHLELALHASMTAVGTFELALLVHWSAVVADRWVRQATRRTYRWIAERVEVQFGGFKFELGVR